MALSNCYPHKHLVSLQNPTQHFLQQQKCILVLSLSHFPKRAPCTQSSLRGLGICPHWTTANRYSVPGAPHKPCWFQRLSCLVIWPQQFGLCQSYSGIADFSTKRVHLPFSVVMRSKLFTSSVSGHNVVTQSLYIMNYQNCPSQTLTTLQGCTAYYSHTDRL